MQRIRISSINDIDANVERIRLTTEIPDDVSKKVSRIIDDVRDRGDSAVIDYTREFDGVSIGPSEIEVPSENIESARASLEAEIEEDLLGMASHIESFSRRSMPSDWLEDMGGGLVLGQAFRPLERVGIYVPGGRYSYPSTVLMAGIPAVVAGVGEICICSPPGKQGDIAPAVLAACAMVKGSRVFRCGGSQAIAAMALGTRSIPSVKRVYGPGNLYVIAAKRAMADMIGGGPEAGPSEIAVLIDADSDLYCAASDIMAQMEHDPVSLGVVLSTDPAVLDNLEMILEGLREETAGKNENVWSVQVKDESTALAFLNCLAPEHLELLNHEPRGLLDRIESAGAVLLGGYSSAVLGDYIAGPSHVLPTGGDARWSSGLGVLDYMKIINIIEYARGAFLRDRETALRISALEGLEWHGRALRSRDGRNDPRGETGQTV